MIECAFFGREKKYWGMPANRDAVSLKSGAHFLLMIGRLVKVQISWRLVHKSTDLC